MSDSIIRLRGRSEPVPGAAPRDPTLVRGGEAEPGIPTDTSDKVALPDSAAFDDTVEHDHNLSLEALVGAPDDVDTLESRLLSGGGESRPAETAEAPPPSADGPAGHALQSAVVGKSRQLLEATMRQVQGRPAQGSYPTRDPASQGVTADDLRHLADGVISSMMEGLLNRSHRVDKRGKRDAAKLLLLIMKAHGAYIYEHCTRLVDLAQSLAAEMGETCEQLDRQVEDGLTYRDLGEVGFFLTRRSARQREALAAYLGGDDMAQDAMLHDLGKIQVPEAILYKPGPLDADERAIMERHPIWGADILERLPPLRHAIPVVRHHHERWDGGGYPDGLAGEGIPLAARIVSVVDAFDAMVSDRPYRQGLPIEEVCRNIDEGSGTQFDPRVAQAFLRIVHQIWSPERHY